MIETREAAHFDCDVTFAQRCYRLKSGFVGVITLVVAAAERGVGIVMDFPRNQLDVSTAVLASLAAGTKPTVCLFDSGKR